MSRKYDVVISGVAGLFPECDDFEELIFKLLNGVDLITKDDRRWTPGDMGVPSATGKLKDPEEFDITLFGIPRKLIEITDPTTRLSIMQGFRAVCDAGVNPNEISGSNTAVIMSSFTSETEDEYLTQNANLGTYGIIANARAMQANRLSFFLNLKGPSNALDSTWCGGVQALQYAQDLIATGQVEAAIVGSCSLLFKPQVSVHYEAMGRLCQDGVTRSFSSDAAGYARSEACVTMFLQRAEDARRCYGTLLVAKTIHRGLRPNYFLDMDPESLESFLRQVYKDAGVDPKDIAYYEACGSASRVLDAKELNVAAKVFLPGRSKPLLVGSIKSNLGHTEGASAMVSLAKALIALDRGVITPNLHYSSPNPDVPAMLSGKIQVVTRTTELEGDLIGLTDIGVSGSTMSHMIVRRNPKAKPPLPNYEELPPDGIPRLVLLSDRNRTNLQNNLKRLDDLQIDEEFCALLNHLQKEGVRGQLHRAYSVMNGLTNSYNQVVPFEWKNERKPIWFMFSGMGSQWPEMGKQLMRLPVFARAVQQCHEILRPKGIDLLDILNNKDPQVFDSILNCFVGIAAVQIGLVDVLRQVGIKPDGMIGHSVGELGCGYADGCLSIEQMILSAYARGKASIEAPLIKGTMAAVGLGYNQIKDQVPDSIDVACHNSSTSCTLSGPFHDMQKFIDELKKRNVFAKLVNVANIAYHSRYIQPAGPLLLDYLKPIIPEPKLRSSRWLSSSNPESQWDSNLSKYSSAEYYTNNLLSAVLFEEVAKHVPQDAILVEIAPHGLLQAIVKRSHPQVTHIPLTSRFDEDNLMYLLGALGKLYVNGVPVDVQRLYPQVKYPVSRGTPALSPFVGWQNTERFGVFLHSRREKESCWKDISVSMREDKYALYAFHKVKDRLVLPNSYYLKKVALKFLKVKEKSSTIISYENVKFPNKAEIPLNGTNLDIDLRFLQGTGTFTFASSSDSEVYASGKLQTMDSAKLRSLERSVTTLSRTTEALCSYTGNDVLDFMDSYGYTLENKFAIFKNVTLGESILTAVIEWNGNIVAFINGLLTLISFFHTKLFNALHMVSEIQQLIVDYPSLKNQPICDVEVVYDHKASTLRCPGVLMFLPETTEVDDSTYLGNTSFEVHRFVPYDFGDVGSSQSAISICHQLIVENRIIPSSSDGQTLIKAVCIGENSFTEDLSSMSKTTSALHLATVESEKILVEQLLSINGEIGWIVSSKVITQSAINRIQAVAPKSFILMPVASDRLGIVQVFSFSLSCEKYALYSLALHSEKKIEKVSLKDDYLPVLESKLIQANERNRQGPITDIVYLIGRIESLSTILGILDETKNLPYYNLLRFFFVDSRENLDEYFGRVNNDLKINVVWNGSLGSLRSFSGMSASSDLALSSGPSLVYSLSSLVHSSEPVVLGLNLSDITGSLNCNDIGVYDIANANMIGVGVYDSLNKTLVQDEILRWDKPRHWSVEDAATVPLLYSLAMSIIKLENSNLPMGSILINQGLTLLSQALLQLLHNTSVVVYVTVQDDGEKKELMSLFPKLNPDNIFNWSSTFHVTLLKKRGGAKVDKVVNTFKDPEMVKPCSYCLDKLGVLIQVSLSPMETKSTMGMLVYNDEIIAVGISAETLLKLPHDKKVEIRDSLAKSIKDGVVRPFAKTTISHEATNIEAVRHLETADAKVIVSFDGKQNTNSSVIWNCEPSKSYVIVNEKNSKSSSWLELAGWLAWRGARNITIVLRDTSITGSHALRTESLKNKYTSLNLTIISMGELSSKMSIDDFITAVDARQELKGVFVLNSKNSRLVQEIHESLAQHGCECDLICFGWGGEKTCEERTSRGLKSLCVRVGSDERDFKIVLEFLDALINQSKRNPIVTVRTLKAADSSSMGKSYIPCNYGELQNLLALSTPYCTFKEILTTAPGIRYTREVNPVYVFPGLRPQNMQKVSRKLLYSAYEVRLAKNMTSVADMAKEVVELMSSTKRNSYMMMAEGWGGILALHVASALESAGKIVRLILIDAGPSYVVQWASDLLKDPISLISNFVDVTYNAKMQLKNCSSWEETVNVAISQSNLSPNEKITTMESLDLLRRRLEGVISSNPPAYKLQRPCYLFNCYSNGYSSQYGLEQYMNTEAVVRAMASDTEAAIIERLADEVNALTLYETEDAANRPREDYLRVAFIKGKTKATA